MVDGISQNYLASSPHRYTMKSPTLGDGAGALMPSPRVNEVIIIGSETDSEVIEPKVEPPSRTGSSTQISPYPSDLDTSPTTIHRLPHTRKSTLTGWPWEMLCCVISMISFGSIVEILLIYDHKPLPEFPLGITLNSIVALLSSICSMSCTFVVSEGVSQMKWNHYARGKPRPLSHLQAFDNASRGAWGSFKLLFLVDSAGSLTLLLVVFFVMITGLLSPSITQSAITNTDTADRFSSVVAASGPSLSIQETSQLRMAVQLGLATPPYANITPVAPICSTGVCDFPEFTTLAVCSTVRSATRLLSFSNWTLEKQQEAQNLLKPVPIFGSSSGNEGQYAANYSWTYVRNASLSTGAFLIGGPEYFSLNVSYSTESEALVRNIPWNHSQSVSETLFFSGEPKLLRAGVINFFVIWLNQAYFLDLNHPPADPSIEYLDQAFRASEVLLYFCLKSVKVEVRDGIPSTVLRDIPFTAQPDDRQTNKSQYLLNLRTEGAPNLFKVDEGSFVSLFYYLRRRLRGTMSFSKTPYWTVRDQTASSEIIGDALWSDRVPWGGSSKTPQDYSIANQDKEQESRLRNITRNLADSLTDMIRQGGGDRGGQQIAGTTLQHGTTRIRWQFLILPGLQVAMSIIFLICVIRQTITLGVELYKSQLLPVLLAINPSDKPHFQSDEIPAASQA